jgi:hypothetical protein
MSATCAEARSLLPARPLEALEEDELAFVEKHLTTCAACRERARAIDHAFEPLRSPVARKKAPGEDPLWARIVAGIEKPVEASPAAPAGPIISIALVCCFCRDSVARDEATYCASCLAPHHVECFRAHGRCSAFGCEETRTVRPHLDRPLEGVRAPARPRLVRVAVYALAACIAGTAAAVAWKEHLTRALEQEQHAAELAQVKADYERRLGDAVAKIKAEMRLTSADIAPTMTLFNVVTGSSELEGKIDGVFAKIESLLAERKVEALVPAFAELNALMDQYPKDGSAAVRKKRVSWNKKLEEWKEIRLAIQLQIDINDGNALLRAMVKAKERGDYDAVETGFAGVERLVERMRREDREEFHRNADAIFVRARALHDEALEEKAAKLEGGKTPVDADLAEGNALVAAISAARDAADYDRVEEQFANLRGLVEHMKKSDQEATRKHADELFAKGGLLYSRAMKEKVCGGPPPK